MRSVNRVKSISHDRLILKINETLSLLNYFCKYSSGSIIIKVNYHAVEGGLNFTKQKKSKLHFAIISYFDTKEKVHFQLSNTDLCSAIKIIVLLKP